MDSLFNPSTIAQSGMLLTMLVMFIVLFMVLFMVLFTVLFNLIKRHSSAFSLQLPTCSTSPVHNGRYMSNMI